MDLRAEPKHVVALSNFAFNESSEEEIQDPRQRQVSVLIAFDPCLFDHLLEVSIDRNPIISRKIHCDNIDWDVEVTGLHCDSQLQLVFVAQPNTVTVMDLSGRVSEQFSDRSLGVEGPSYLCAIAGDADKIFLLDRNGPRLLVRNKRAALENLRLVSLSSEPLLIGSDLGSLAVSGDSVFVSDNRTGRVFKLNASNECLTEHSEALGTPELCRIAADSCGHVIVSAFVSNTVTVLDSDGTVLQTLSGAQDMAFHFPCAVTVLESAEGGLSLIVANYGNNRLYSMGLAAINNRTNAANGEKRTSFFSSNRFCHLGA